MNQPRIRTQAAALAAAFLLAACAAPPAGRPATPASPAGSPPAETIAAPPAMRTEGVPPLPARLHQLAQRYSAVVGHGFVDWHPTKREMLVAHRAPGTNTAQLFRLRGPQAALEPLTTGAEPVTSARFEPVDGRYVVFARASGGDEAYQLHRLDPETRATTQITPDGQRHTLWGWVRSAPGGALAVVASVPLDRTAEGGRRAQIATTVSLIDPLRPDARRVLTELPGGGWFAGEVSRDDRQLTLTRYVSAAESEVWLVDLQGAQAGQRRRLLPAEGETGLRAAHYAGAWTRDGRSLLIASDRASEFVELMRLDIASGTLTRLTASTPWDTSDADTSPDGRTAAVAVNVDGRDELQLLDVVSGQRLSLPRTLPGGSVDELRFHPATGDLAFINHSPLGPAQVLVMDAARTTVTPWTTPVGAAELNLAELPEQRIVRWTSFDGRTISGVLSLPPARFTGPRPVVMLMHGGPEAQAKQGWNGRWNLLIQHMGVALLEPNVRGSRGYGKTFLALDNGRLREDSVKDMASAIDWIATQPNLDARRVLVTGGSYGGYMALAAATLLNNRIAGAASTVGISNFVTFLENTESYRRDLRRVEYGDERDPAMRAFLQEISPLNRAHRITRPLMVAQGRNDPRVPWTESEQIVRSLQQRGTPVWYLLADDEGHGFAKRENADYWFTAFSHFVERTLKP
jgi:dipeptidyl aminopeptidase/acylaminoacyl peptidase